MMSVSHSSDVLSPSSNIEGSPSRFSSVKTFTASWTFRPSYNFQTLSGGIVRLDRLLLGDWLLGLREVPLLLRMIPANAKVSLEI